MTIRIPNGFNLDNFGKRIVVDPVTRIEGHLRVEVNVDYNNLIRNAVCTGTMWRGIETILQRRDPAMPGPSPSAFAASHRHPALPGFARSRTLSIKIPDTRIRSATSSSSRCRCTTTSCTSITCTRSTGWTSSWP